MIKYSKLIYSVLCGLVLAMTLHIFIILALPYFSQNNAWYRISKTLKPYNITLLSTKRFADGKPLISNLDPIFMVAACHFDLEDGRVLVEAKGFTPYWSLSLYDVQSANHYSLSNNNTNPLHLNAVLTTEDQSSELTPKASGDEKNKQVTIKLPFKKGIAVIRVLHPDETWEVPATEFIKNARCQPLDITATAQVTQ